MGFYLNKENKTLNLNTYYLKNGQNVELLQRKAVHGI